MQVIKRCIFINSKNQKYSRRFDYHAYLWFRYHKLFFGSLIFRGRKLWAFNFFLRLKYELKIREGIDSFWVFLVAVMQITPDMLLFPKKMGGAIHYVPMPIGERKQYTFAIKWIIKLLRDKNNLTLDEVASTLVNAIYQEGLSYNFKLDYYNRGMANRHLIRYFNR